MTTSIGPRDSASGSSRIDSRESRSGRWPRTPKALSSAAGGASPSEASPGALRLTAFSRCSCRGAATVGYSRGLRSGTWPPLLISRASSAHAVSPPCRWKRNGVTQPLGRGINLGNALDVARDETPRLVLEERHLLAVKAAGFDFIRLPVCWSAHAERSVPYTIDGALFERVDRVIEEAIRRDLTVILDVHHYRELQRNPSRHTARFLALWRQIARRYATSSDRLLFELLNEPCDAMTAERWNTLLAQALDVVRESCPDHTVVVGPASMNDAAALPALRLPDDDRMLVKINYYAPMQFTHQGARWLANAEQWVGTVWGTEDDRDAVSRDLTQAAAWGRASDLPLLVGEFGTYERADLPSRQRWTEWVRREADRLALSWCYWDLATDFGAYDQRRNEWREPLRRALLATAP
jgi:endoglucanase